MANAKIDVAIRRRIDAVVTEVSLSLVGITTNALRYRSLVDANRRRVRTPPTRVSKKLAHRQIWNRARRVDIVLISTGERS
jgi:hypothetical protein